MKVIKGDNKKAAALLRTWMIQDEEKNRASQTVMDLFFALRAIKGRPTLRDLVKLARRIKS